MNSKWHSTQLSSLLSGKPRNGLYKGAEYQGVGCRWIKMKDIYGSDFIKNQAMMLIDATPSEIERFGCEDGDLLFGRTSLTLEGIGDCALLCQPRDTPIFESNLFRVRFDRSKADPRFFYYFFKSPQGKELIQSIAKQTAATSITATDLIGLDVPCPDLAEQHKVSGFLHALDDRITLLRETSATLEAIAQALFKSWFVDFDPVRAKAEGLEPEGLDMATAALFPDSFEESELGLVPRGWLASTLDDISDVGIGKTPPRKEAHWFSESPDDMRWVSIRDMGSSGAFLTETSEYLTADAVSRFNVRRVPDNTVLLSFKMTIGRVAITSGEMTTNEAIAHCKITEQSPLASEYIYLHLRQFDYSTLSSTSSIADAVNSKTVKAISILIPDADVAAAFQRTVSVIFDRVKTVQQQAKALTQLRNTLLPRLINGQLRLPEAEVMVEEVCA
ncbi:restriction endonuclease subunit S [Pseudomonas silesiensis]|uniref:restriction endonuclease subunit S n=1 Tax=Pseudomonas silesiensis TaxID=1853130 RepID=UPI0030D5CDEE